MHDTELIFQMAFYMGAILVLVSTIVFTLLQRHTDRPQNKLFLLTCVTLLVTCVTEITTKLSYPDAAYSRGAFAVYSASIFLYFLLHLTLPLSLFYYALFATRFVRQFSVWRHIFWMLPFLVSEFFVLTNPALHLMYHLDENLEMQRGVGEYLSYAVATAYFFGSLSIMLYRWHPATQQKKRILLFSMLTTVVGVVVQLIAAPATIELFAESIMMMGLMISIEYDEDLRDSSTNVLNRNALLLDLRSFFEMKISYSLIVIQFRNMDVVRRILGIGYQDLIKELAESIRAVHPRYLIYRPTPSAFLLLTPGTNREKTRALADTVCSRVLADWEERGREMSIRMTVLLASLPEELSKTEDVLLLTESTLPEKEDGLPLEGEDLKSLFDQAALAEALHRGIADHNFKMVYQLVFSADKRRVIAAESLLRLRDPKLGNVYPGDFIPVAERIGIIRLLGEYALREVCAFLSTDLPDKLGIRFVAVNLSIIQCTNPDFVEHASAIVKESGVDPSRICFEISETAAAVDYKLLSNTIRELKAIGFLFSMDGYGSGYANMYSIFSMDFDLIKMDRNLLYAAEESEEGRIVLESSARMIHELHRKVVVIGVETREQLAEIRSFPVDYVQGNYLSPAESPDELRMRSVI